MHGGAMDHFLIFVGFLIAAMVVAAIKAKVDDGRPTNERRRRFRVGGDDE